MARENKHDRFSRELCEGLLPHFGPGYIYRSGRPHSLVMQTAFGSQRCGVLLPSGYGGAKRLEFVLGVRHDRFQDVVSRLSLDDSYPADIDHFWSTSFNCIRHLVPGTDASMGCWEILLRDSGGDYVPVVLPALRALSDAFFTKFSDLRAARDAVLGHDGTLFNLSAWQQVAIADLALKDYAHLREFAVREMRGWGMERDEALWHRIRHEFADAVIA